MNLKKQLPMIGVEQQNGVFRYGDHKKSIIYNSRPDYEEFKSGVFKTEQECVSVLVGWAFLDSNIMKELLSRRAERLDKFLILGCLEKNDQIFNDHQELLSLFNEIREMIDDGLVPHGGAPPIVYHQPEIGPEALQGLFKDEVFFSFRRLHSIQFLNWAEKNGYVIPQELARTPNGEGWAKGGDYEKSRQAELIENSFVKDAVRVAAIVGALCEREKPMKKDFALKLFEQKKKKGNEKYPFELIWKSLDEVDGVKQGRGRPKEKKE